MKKTLQEQLDRINRLMGDEDVDLSRSTDNDEMSRNDSKDRFQSDDINPRSSGKVYFKLVIIGEKEVHDPGSNPFDPKSNKPIFVLHSKERVSDIKKYIDDFENKFGMRASEVRITVL
jgi:hypothetical protein